jgi:hypothetical protein
MATLATPGGRTDPLASHALAQPKTGPLGEAASRRATVLRRVEIAFLTPRGDVDEVGRLVPALPAFEEAFCAFARGTLFPTAQGHVAVEDLWPGMEVRRPDGGTARLLWRGSTMIVPASQGQDPAMTRLTRISAEAMGFGRPFQDLMLGPKARLVNRRPAVRLLTGREAALLPASDLVDGVAVVEVAPPTAVEVFHLAFDRHERLLANGIEVESYHPGPLHSFPLRGEPLAQFLGCFPHRTELACFGEPALPRLRLRDLDLFDAA